ncbi:MAG: hypothetical protein IIA90_04595 [Chloroflexi bacterium]|nr:hypothetical protein [Chloroflexota bacterium]
MATGSSNPRHANRHEWNRYEDYRQVNERKLAEYAFIEKIELAFEEIAFEGELFIEMNATLALPQNVILDVTKFFETRRRGPGRGRLYVRCISYRYNAWILGKHNVLRYDNNDDFDDYHGHWWDKNTGELIERRSMSRDDFPLFSDVLDELDEIMGFTDTG